MQLLLGYVQTAMLTTRGVWVPSGLEGSRLTLAGTQLGLPSDSAIITLLCSKVYLPVASSPRFVSSIHLSGAWAAAKPKPNPVVQTG